MLKVSLLKKTSLSLKKVSYTKKHPFLNAINLYFNEIKIKYHFQLHFNQTYWCRSGRDIYFFFQISIYRTLDSIHFIFVLLLSAIHPNSINTLIPSIGIYEFLQNQYLYVKSFVLLFNIVIMYIAQVHSSTTLYCTKPNTTPSYSSPLLSKYTYCISKNIMNIE